MIYFEYLPWVVHAGHAPGLLCCTKRKSIRDPFNGSTLLVSLAERIFEVRGNKVIELKNRLGNFKESPITSEEKVVLVLKAVPIQ